MQQDVKIENLVEGSGKAIERGALITVHYRGYLDDGTEFDSSHKNNAPFQVV
ncbi:MAG: FKBP-type peptidyl-prolyl cis-trans isomerase, partial [Paraglaciecola chathamensis]